MSLDDTLNAVERAKLAVWDYPVSDKYTKLWETMKTSHFPNTEQEAKERILKSEFAFICRCIHTLRSFRVRWVVGSISHGGFSEPFLVSANAPQLV